MFSSRYELFRRSRYSNKNTYIALYTSILLSNFQYNLCDSNAGRVVVQKKKKNPSSFTLFPIRSLSVCLQKLHIYRYNSKAKATKKKISQIDSLFYQQQSFIYRRPRWSVNLDSNDFVFLYLVKEYYGSKIREKFKSVTVLQISQTLNLKLHIILVYEYL